MSAKRSTPQPRIHSSRVAQNLNSTVVFGRQLSLPRFRGGSASKLLHKTQSVLDITGVGLSGCPTIKANLPTSCAAAVDYELESSLVCSGYLQALMKKEIVEKAIRKHEQDLQDQLVIQNDKMHKSKMVFQKNQQEVQRMYSLKGTRDILKTVEGNIDAFARLKEDTDFEGFLKQFLFVLDEFSKKLHVKNVKLITDQEDYDRLLMLLEKLETVIYKIKLSDRHIEAVDRLAGLLQKYQEVSSSVVEKQSLMNNLHKNGTYKLLKMISDMYVVKEQYEKTV